MRYTKHAPTHSHSHSHSHAPPPKFPLYIHDCLFKNRDKVSFDYFKKALQCAAYEPDIAGQTGSLLLSKKVYFTKYSIEVFAAYVESKFGCENFRQCSFKSELLKKKLKKSSYEEIDVDGRFEVDNRTFLIRIINGKMYYDWPFGISRVKSKPDYHAYRLFGAVLELIKDVPDMAFFARDHDFPLFPISFAAPSFSHSPTLRHSDIPLPWIRSVATEVSYHKKQLVEKANIFFLNPNMSDYKSWEERKSRAVWYGLLWNTQVSNSRMVALDLSRARPDLLEAKWTETYFANAYNPHSTEQQTWTKEDLMKRTSAGGGTLETENDIILNKRSVLGSSGSSSSSLNYGYLRNYGSQYLNQSVPMGIFINDFKYLIVLEGNNGVDRLDLFLAHSGAVVLLQESISRR